MKLVIDSREPQSMKDGFQKYFRENIHEPIEFEIKELQAGDFMIDNILIERKEINDFYSSIMDNRYSSQKVKLASQVSQGMHVYVFIHGDVDNMYKAISPRVYSGAVASLCEAGINVLHLPDSETYIYEMVYALIRKYNPSKVLETPFIRPAVDNFTQKCLMCIPGVGEETASNIIAEYSPNLASYYAELNHERLVEELTRVKGVGIKTARKIVKTLHGEKE